MSCLHLVSPTYDLAPLIQQYASDPAITTQTLMPDPYPENGAIQFLDYLLPAMKAQREFAFAIFDQEAFIGMAGIHTINWAAKVGHIGYWLGRPFWGKGYATTALALMTAYGFEGLGLAQLKAYILSENLGSIRVAEKVGYRRERTFIEQEVAKFLGRTSHLYQLDRHDWLAKR